MKREYITHGMEQTRALAAGWGREAAPGNVFALCGELGSGKTIIAKGIAEGMGIIEDVTSPTFNLLDIHEGRVPLYHFDLYRIESESELDQLFFEEYWEGDGVSVIEWAERAGNRLPRGTITVRLEYCGENDRRITVEHPDS